MLFRETILVTGFPGFLATRLVEKLARSEVQFFLLVQPQFVEQAMEEAAAISEATSTPLECFSIIEGDIREPHLGASEEDLEAIRREVTSVFHFAAIYDLGIDRDSAIAVNVEGTRNVNELVGEIANLRRYNYISTCYVAGERTGRILETELEHSAGFKNFYEESKYLAELEVERLKEKLPVTIFRPSVVVGDSESGETAKYDGIYYLIQYLRKAPIFLRILNVGNKRVRLNLVPVDFVVDAIAALSSDEDAEGKTLAIADPEPLTTSEIFDAIAYSLTGRKSEFAPSVALTKWFLNTSISPVITGLPHYGVPYFFIEQEYDTAVADELLKKHGIACPPFSSYVGNLIDFVEENPEL
ncbi:MAG: sterol-4-alpha-carboxylate 3-dehydrogenase [Acidobacteria bacterium OLB17]|nr:MAG: sterol-4-alpha-carboxylate 3-dehydrogenase [Acidobacteria bacterium OLB17]MCZ2390444.1 SDR family oxidoreductase [Acidobacteriota bacterium]